MEAPGRGGRWWAPGDAPAARGLAGCEPRVAGGRALALKMVSRAEEPSACGVAVWGETRDVWGEVHVSVTQGRSLRG